MRERGTVRQIMSMWLCNFETSIAGWPRYDPKIYPRELGVPTRPLGPSSRQLCDYKFASYFPIGFEFVSVQETRSD